MMRQNFSGLVLARASKLLCGLALLAAPLLATPTHSAQAADRIEVQNILRESIAVVDIQRIMTQSKAAKSIQEQIESHRDRYQAEIQREERELNQARESLAKRRSVLSAEAYDKERRAFERKLANTQRGLQERKGKLEQALARAMDDVQKQMLGIIGNIAEQRQIVLVLARTQLILVENKMDITDTVLSRLDDALTHVKVTVK